MLTRYTFSERKFRREVKTFCAVCNKKLRRVLTDVCYDNGLHDMAATAREKNKELDEEAADMKQNGTICGKCYEAKEKERSDG